MKCGKCSVDFVWDSENPPGYVCPSCGGTENACMVCEEPCADQFCGPLCEGQWYEDLEKELEKTEDELGQGVKDLGREINRLGEELLGPKPTN